MSPSSRLRGRGGGIPTAVQHYAACPLLFSPHSLFSRLLVPDCVPSKRPLRQTGSGWKTSRARSSITWPSTLPGSQTAGRHGLVNVSARMTRREAWRSWVGAATVKEIREMVLPPRSWEASMGQPASARTMRTHAVSNRCSRPLSTKIDRQAGMIRAEGVPLSPPCCQVQPCVEQV